jgi:simple sugar transport system permease protein
MINPGERGIGIAHTFELGLPAEEITARHGDMIPGLARSMNNIWQVEFTYALVAISVTLLAYTIIRRYMAYKNPALGQSPLWKFCLQAAACVAVVIFSFYSAYQIYHWNNILEATRAYLGNDRLSLLQLEGVPPFVVEISNINHVPVVTGLVILAVGLFTIYFTRTKLGQDCRSVGQSQHIANVAGINVDRTRIIATIISTVIASWGMIIFLHDIGHVATYSAHSNIGFFSIAAILVGGATAAKANVKNAIIGIFLFHAMFILSPAIGRFISDDGNVGEYMRTFMVYGVIGVSLGLYVWKNNRAAKEKERLSSDKDSSSAQVSVNLGDPDG